MMCTCSLYDCDLSSPRSHQADHGAVCTHNTGLGAVNRQRKGIGDEDLDGGSAYTSRRGVRDE